MRECDVIVIGAGNGGLSVSATLAEKGKSVILFEKHNIPGGCATSFRRGRFEFEVALHQISHLGTKEKPGSLRKQLASYGIKDDEIEWIPIKDLFRVNFADGSGYSFPVGQKDCEEFLCKEFPSEEKAVHKYFKICKKYCKEVDAFAAMGELSGGKEPGKGIKNFLSFILPRMFKTLAEYSFKSVQEVLDEIFTDTKLKMTLSTYWCFFGVPPERLPFSILAKCSELYYKTKPHYLKGTSMMLSQAIMNSIEKMGSEVKLNCGVEKIILENGKSVGVIDEYGNEYRAKKIISSISPLATYGNFLKPEEIPEEAKEYLKPYTVGVSALTCFLGLDCPPEELGFKASFNIHYNTTDINTECKEAYNLMPEKDPLVATCYTFDDPKLSPPGTSLVTALVLKYGTEWEKLSAEEYYQKKYEAGQIMIDRLEKLYPGIKDHIEEMEIATPLTYMRYLNHPGGGIYGYEQDLLQTVFFFPNESKLPNLEFVGGWATICGYGPNLTYGQRIGKRLAKKI